MYSTQYCKLYTQYTVLQSVQYTVLQTVHIVHSMQTIQPTEYTVMLLSVCLYRLSGRLSCSNNIGRRLPTRRTLDGCSRPPIWRSPTHVDKCYPTFSGDGTDYSSEASRICPTATSDSRLIIGTFLVDKCLAPI